MVHLISQCCVGMATVVSFVQCPSEELLNSCTKEQLVEYYEVNIGDKWLKEEVKGLLKTTLVEKGVLPATVQAVDDSVVSHPVVLTFEQQNKLLLLQMERGKLSI